MRPVPSRELATLNDPQKVAVAELLRRQLRAEGRIDWLRDAVFFVLGVLVSVVVKLVLS